MYGCVCTKILHVYGLDSMRILTIQGVKSPNIQAAPQEIRPEGPQFSRCLLTKRLYGWAQQSADRGARLCERRAPLADAARRQRFTGVLLGRGDLLGVCPFSSSLRRPMGHTDMI